MKVLKCMYCVNVLLSEIEQVWEDSDSMFYVYQMTVLSLSNISSIFSFWVNLYIHVTLVDLFSVEGYLLWYLKESTVTWLSQLIL
jgi:hypothetical protein